MRVRGLLLGIFTVSGVCLPFIPMNGRSGDREATPSCRPIALALADRGKTLFIANRDNGTISVVDTQKLQLVKEQKIGERLSSIALSQSGDLLAATDETAGELIVLEHKGENLREIQRYKTAMNPVSVRLSEDGKIATVACLWSRRLMIFQLAVEAPPVVLDLSFAPRVQFMVPGTKKLVVADAFGGNLALVNVERQKIESTRILPVHNIRGLAIDSKQKHLLVTHQVLSARGRTTGGEIQTSNLITNNVRRLLLAAVLDPLADVHRDDQVFQLGGVERGAGDPAEIHETPTGETLIALAGVNELAIGRPEQVIWSLIPVGRRPTALAVDDARQRAYVANTFDDSVAVIDLRKQALIREIKLGRPNINLSAEQRGEMLFFDARLSFESWFSCHSCHPDGHTNGRLNDNLSDGSFGTPKRVLSLLGSKDTGPWAWNGSVKDLETQIRTSLKSTMQGPGLSADGIRDLAAYLRTLPPPPSLSQARAIKDDEAIKRGRKIFSEQKCATCHPAPTYTSPKTFDVGLKDEAGGSHFNPPSLRGISQAGPYFHDGRASALEEVFTRFGHQLSRELHKQELHDLMQYLNSL